MNQWTHGLSESSGSWYRSTTRKLAVIKSQGVKVFSADPAYTPLTECQAAMVWCSTRPLKRSVQLSEWKWHNGHQQLIVMHCRVCGSDDIFYYISCKLVVQESPNWQHEICNTKEALITQCWSWHLWDRSGHDCTDHWTCQVASPAGTVIQTFIAASISHVLVSSRVNFKGISQPVIRAWWCHPSTSQLWCQQWCRVGSVVVWNNVQY